MRVSTLVMLGVIAAASTGCTDSVKPTSVNSFTYDCSGLGKGWGDCTQKADAQCGVNKYTVVSRKGESDDKGTSGNTEMKRTMEVTCKP